MMKILTHLHILKNKNNNFIFILNQILLTIIIIHFE